MTTLDETARWQAVLKRDPSADGAFYYAVSSTGVYCRPTCPSRRPNQENVTFFDSADAARRAGFRPCQRCHPDSVTDDQLAVAKVLRLVEDEESDLTLEELADQVGFSPGYLQRVFKRRTGLSPKQYAASLRRRRFREGLHQGSTVTAAVYDAGYGSTRAAYEHAPDHLGMKPAAFKRGGRDERIAYAVWETKLGHVLAAATERGICAVYIGRPDELTAQLAIEFPNAELAEDAHAMSSYAQAVADAVATGRASGVSLDPRGTDFQQKVWAALRTIPPGETRTYRQIAEAIGHPNAARAVARACAVNPIALLTPCHRVVRADGALAGYRWGIERKRALLDREGAAR